MLRAQGCTGAALPCAARCLGAGVDEHCPHGRRCPASSCWQRRRRLRLTAAACRSRRHDHQAGLHTTGCSSSSSSRSQPRQRQRQATTTAVLAAAGAGRLACWQRHQRQRRRCRQCCLQTAACQLWPVARPVAWRQCLAAWSWQAAACCQRQHPACECTSCNRAGSCFRWCQPTCTCSMGCS